MISAEAVETGGRPELLRVVVGRERRNRVRQRDPAQLRPRVDVNVRRHARRVVERAGADEQDARARVAAVDRDLARRAAEDPLLLAAAAGYVDRRRLAGQQLDAVGFDQRVDDERAAGLPLAVEAVTAVREERVRRQPIPNLSAGAAAFEHVARDLPPKGSWGNQRLPHDSIGVRRFELRTSPTRTERATRLRHTPSGERVAIIGPWLSATRSSASPTNCSRSTASRSTGRPASRCSARTR